MYGLIIDAYPVAMLNGFIALTNIFYLRKMLRKTQHNFSIVKVNRPSNYVDFFLDYHREEIEGFFPRFLKIAAVQQREYYFLMEHSQVIGMLSGIRESDTQFVVDFDFVIPEYRDCRLGQFVLGAEQELKRVTGYQDVGATADSVAHEQYLASLGFSPDRKGIWRLQSVW